MDTGLYARYSIEEQRPTSIEDQLRRCREVARKEGLTICEQTVFSDDAVTGTAKGRHKRPGYQALIDGIEAGEIRCLVVDEISRLTRDVEEAGKLMNFVENRGLKIVAANGMDTRAKGWQTSFLVGMLIAKLEVEGIAFRSTRGMLGQLERGYQIAQPPIGYQLVRDVDGNGKPVGTRWVIDETEARVVRNIFEWRYEGLSGSDIARRLQAQGVSLPQPRRCKGPAYWRPGNVFRILNNAIYRGIFTWNGSSFSKAKARRTGAQLVTLEFAREQYRLVSDDLWYSVNPAAKGTDKVLRGSGKHLFSGMVHCGECGATLSVGGAKVSKTLYCAQCEVGVRVNGKAAWLGYSSVGAGRSALLAVLSEVFSGPALDDFRARLKNRLTRGPARELEELTQEAGRVRAQGARIKAILLDPRIDTEEFAPEMAKLSAQRKSIAARMDALRSESHGINAQALESQLSIEPLALLEQLIDGHERVSHVRAVIKRLLSEFTFIARPSKGVSVFRITLLPGVYVAEVSGTAKFDSTEVTYEVTASVTARRPVAWETVVRAVN
jgi:DNA invertase Pin-like site-specific DNA recombinase